MRQRDNGSKERLDSVAFCAEQLRQLYSVSTFTGGLEFMWTIKKSRLEQESSCSLVENFFADTKFKLFCS